MDGKNRSFALSYAKDIIVAQLNSGKEKGTKDLFELAEKMNEWLDGKVVYTEKELPKKTYE